MKLFQRLYEGMMLILVMVTIMTLWIDHASNTIVNWIVWFIFVVDFFYRFFTTSEKWSFLKQNPFLIIAIIPFDQFFQIARFVRIVYLFRMKTVTKYYIQPFINRMSYQARVIITSSVVAMLFIHSFILWILEESILTVSESFLYVAQHLLFFGQRIIEVESTLSLLLLVLTTIIGVLLHGIALQWLFQKGDELFHSYKKVRVKNVENQKNNNI